MCGILGIVAGAGDSAGIGRPELLRMRDAMQARGPDDAGYYVQQNVALAHRRLAIRDRRGGAQPWVSADGKCVLVYNGEVYNDGELRRELAAGGYRFRSRSDTEVVMAAYLQWGTHCAEHLRGMFAFGIYDFRDDSLLLVRDRFGIKPLFVAEVDRRLVFASSIAAILRHPRFNAAPYLPAVSHYLTTLRLTLGRSTVFRGIWQLLPGEMLVKRGDEIVVSSYWDYPPEAPEIDEETAAGELESGLREAVQCRLASDVPVGMFLSGGVDSSTIAALMRETTPKPLIGRCGGAGGESAPGDFDYARRCARHARFDFEESRVSAEEYRECWQWMVGQYATPVSTPSDVIIYRLSADMKPSVGVVLGGEGADELLCGYAVQHWAGNDFDRFRRLKADRWDHSPAAAGIFRASLRRQYGCDEFASPTEHYFALNSLIPSAAKRSLLQPWAWKRAEEDRPAFDLYAAQLEGGEGSTADRQTLLLHRVNLEALLSRLDSATMLAGLEARVPFTDHHLVERMFRVPRRFKIDVAHGEHAPYLCSSELDARGTLQSKRVLRRVASGLLPATLAMRPKASFPTPVAQWLGGDWRPWARQTLLDSPFGRELFERRAIRELADNIPSAGMWLWPLLNVVIWGDRQFAA